MAKPLRQLAEVLLSDKRRADGRLHDSGLIRPYRTCPPDFRERFIELGWEGIEDHYSTNWRCIRRWIEQCGGVDLRRARAAYVQERGCIRLHAVPLD